MHAFVLLHESHSQWLLEGIDISCDGVDELGTLAGLQEETFLGMFVLPGSPLFQSPRRAGVAGFPEIVSKF